jgi:phosphoglycolate phosphatase
MRYRLAIFDFDGTLADSFAPMLAGMAAAAQRHGFKPFDLDRLDDYRGMGPRQLMAELDIPLWKLPRVVTTMRRDLAARLGEVRLFDGVAGCLAALRSRGVRTAVVSTNSRSNIETVLGALATQIDHYDCGASMFGKAGHLRRVVRRSGVPAAQALCVGDEVRDIEAAAAAGLDIAAVAWGYALPHALAGAGAPVLDSFEALLAHIEG